MIHQMGPTEAQATKQSRRNTWTWWLALIGVPALATITTKLWADATTTSTCTVAPGSPSIVWLWVLLIALVVVIPGLGVYRRQRVTAIVLQTVVTVVLRRHRCPG